MKMAMIVTSERANLLSRLGALLGLAFLSLLGGGGCQTYTYINVDTRFDPVSVDTPLAFRHSNCRIAVSGADQDEFALPCPPPPGQLKIADFQYSTFASSGEITFTMSGRDSTGGVGEEITRGEVSVTLMEGKTLTAVLLAKRVGAAP
jgi:hypothetical protein